jgi:hypothetical protein
VGSRVYTNLRAAHLWSFGLTAGWYDSERIREKRFGLSLVLERWAKIEHWQNIRDVVKWSGKYSYTAVPLLEGNDTYINPWLAAHATIIETNNLCPLVAVNPILPPDEYP